SIYLSSILALKFDYDERNIHCGTKITFPYIYFCLMDRSVDILLPHHSTDTHNTSRHTGLTIQCWLQHHALAGLLTVAAAAGAGGVARSQPAYQPAPDYWDSHLALQAGGVVHTVGQNFPFGQGTHPQRAMHVASPSSVGCPDMAGASAVAQRAARSMTAANLRAGEAMR
uniref:Uncharacterized protein n=1 Tax=Aegilops tauschii subsp. strangulata TaxID=200361 RepID=A0A453QJ57_AEGTS